MNIYFLRNETTDNPDQLCVDSVEEQQHYQNTKARICYHILFDNATLSLLIGLQRFRLPYMESFFLSTVAIGLVMVFAFTWA